ncbi:PEP-utilizing enzyme [Pseudoalteromonas sp. OOF1S-7]|uniref:PEP-utilizing enzyme n=1 Tax=Pseudoalteromonas sp. OOF1S-7 TaxID=2917757 RepID=UPI001EF6DCC7|nr:PEP-utilizing enzyme [Pseudoalteromonas sp. OOF1S-7]MCG7537133.1 PEP-utilizing enzyme [Pseudoalteromonas sp. OOF1S-7]
MNTYKAWVVDMPSENIAQGLSALSKAETLQAIKERPLNARILDLVIIHYSEWLNMPEQCLTTVKSQFDSNVIVRSSSQQEDTAGSSLAGEFLSVLDVPLDSESLTKQINAVFASFGKVAPDDQVFVQKMLTNVEVAGVAFSHDPNTGAPYTVINADLSGDTASITSGTGEEGHTWFILHGTPATLSWQIALLEMMEQLSHYFEGSPIDVEFAFSEGQLYLLQARPLWISKTYAASDPQLQLELRCIEKKLNRLSQPHPYLHGKTTMYGVMPDWNPAEIIGIKPRALALSLYKELVTDDVWAHQRADYGYRDVVGFPLLTVLGGTPYIDVRTSFNSFIPATLDSKLADKLVNDYLQQLAAHPQSHDKVEFDIVISCFTFDLDSKLDALGHHFSRDEKAQLKASLIKLSNRIFSGIWRDDLNKIERLVDKQKTIVNSDLNKIDKIYWLLQDCKSFGTLPFAGLARCGFIAVQLLNSMRSCGLLTEQEVEQFMLSIETVSSQLVQDQKELSMQALIAKYGHLRPGTYDIDSARYDEAPERYFCEMNHEEKGQCVDFSISLRSLNAINEELTKNQLEIDAVGLLNFIKEAIEAREYAKFIFTKSLSDAIKIIEALGNQLGFTRAEMANVDIKDILKLYSTSLSAKESIKASIHLGRNYHSLSQAIKLPALICDVSEVRLFQLLEDEPNFITQLHVTGEPIVWHEQQSKAALKGKIVFIDSADPGYDWLFSTGIVALVTQYGGRNSHMAIRAGELGLPAIIGAGEKHFHSWKRYKMITLDCLKQKVECTQ